MLGGGKLLENPAAKKNSVIITKMHLPFASSLHREAALLHGGFKYVSSLPSAVLPKNIPNIEKRFIGKFKCTS